MGTEKASSLKGEEERKNCEKAISYNSDCGQFICTKDLNFLPPMFTFFLFLIFPDFLGNKSLATTSSTSQPRFISQGHTYRAVVGDTLTLPCEVENLGEFPLRRWKSFLTTSENFCNNLIDMKIDMFKTDTHEDVLDTHEVLSENTV